MDKLKTKLALACIIASTCSGAMAYDSLDVRPYAGVEYRLSTNQGATVNNGFGQSILKDHASSLVLIGGAQITEIIGVEASLSHNILNLAKSDNVDARVSSVGVGVTAQYPLTDYVYAKAMLGASWGRLDLKDGGVKQHYTSDAEFAGKAGLGYVIDDQNVIELTYSYALNSDGVAIQYKHYF